MATNQPKTPSILLEAIKFAGGIDRETAYEDLTKTALDAGWVWHLRQSDVIPLQNGMMVNFDVMLGKADGELATVDTMTVVVPNGPGPVSSAARGLASQSLIHLFFGRLPPVPVAQIKTQFDRPLPAGHEDYDEPEGGSRNEDLANRLHNDRESTIAVVERRTPDGLPVFGDLYALGSPGPVVVDAVLAEIESVLPDITSNGALMALWQENVEAMQYVQDLGTGEQRQDLKRMLDRRKAAIEESGAVAPRRRSAQVVN